MSDQSPSETTLGSADIMDVLRLLPHRYPFLLVDKIVDIDGLNSAIGIKNVTANEPHFQGHFPDNPIMPGVLIIEGMAQTAAVVGIREAADQGPMVVYFMTIDKAKFRRPVVPGDVLEYHVKLVKKRGTIYRFDCEGIVAGEKVAEAQVAAMLAPRTDD